MSILLLREKEDPSDKYHAEFEKTTNCIVHSIPVLSYDFVNTTQLSRTIQNIHGYSGIIFTSKRAVEALSKASDGCHFKEEIIRNNLNVYAVGKSTESDLKSIGLSSVGSETGNAKELSALIVEREKCSTKPILFLRGNLAKGTIPKTLSEAGIPYELLTCYETIPHKNFGEDFAMYENRIKISLIVFFSPSGAEFFLSYIKNTVVNFEKIKIICIGQTTADAIKALGARVAGVARKPTPICLVEAVQNALKVT